jgi:uncharacterized protein YkwD
MHSQTDRACSTWFSHTVIVIAAGALLALFLALAAPRIGGLEAERADASSCEGADRGPRKLSRPEARRAVVCVINNKRQAHGVGNLNVVKPLQKAGGRHARTMMAQNCFDHQCSGEAPLSTRVHNTSYLPCSCSWGLGENLAWGKKSRGSPARIVDAWMNSPPHRSTLLNPAFSHVGIGIAWGSPWKTKMRAATYTADFGYKR